MLARCSLLLLLLLLALFEELLFDVLRLELVQRCFIRLLTIVEVLIAVLLVTLLNAAAPSTDGQGVTLSRSLLLTVITRLLNLVFDFGRGCL